MRFSLAYLFALTLYIGLVCLSFTSGLFWWALYPVMAHGFPKGSEMHAFNGAVFAFLMIFYVCGSVAFGIVLIPEEPADG